MASENTLMITALRKLWMENSGRSFVPLGVMIGVCAVSIPGRQCLAGSGASFVNISYQWQDYAGARDVVVDASGHAWFVGDRAHVFHYDPGTGIYDLQNGVSINNSALEYTAIDIFDNSRKLIVVGNGGVWEAELPPLPQPAVADLTYDGSISLDFDGIAGVYYLLQCSNDLVTWTSENLVIQGLGETETIVIPTSIETRKFYRIVIAE
jgi:hypothetical protein